MRTTTLPAVNSAARPLRPPARRVHEGPGAVSQAGPLCFSGHAREGGGCGPQVSSGAGGLMSAQKPLESTLKGAVIAADKGSGGEGLRYPPPPARCAAVKFSGVSCCTANGHTVECPTTDVPGRASDGVEAGAAPPRWGAVESDRPPITVHRSLRNGEVGATAGEGKSWLAL